MTTAQREAWKLDGRERAHVGFEVEGLGEGLVREAADPRDVVGIRSELRFALDVFATVPERRREVKALAVRGFKYEEIQATLGLTYTRVNRLMTEANTTIQNQRHTAELADAHGAPRARRLAELEADPPKWLRAAIGGAARQARARRGDPDLAPGRVGDRRLPARARCAPEGAAARCPA